MQTVHVRITGRVQGVGYRAWTVDNARKLGVKGWVRNRRDGSVEAIFQGEEASVFRLLGLCEDGPMFARVSNVLVDDIDAETTFDNFTNKETL